MTGVSSKSRLFYGLIGILSVISLSLFFFDTRAAQAAVSFNSPTDCDNNAVIFCGAMTTADLQQKYNADSSVQAIFGCFGITAADIGNIGNTAVAGSVSKDGTVTVNGQVVATNAITAGRQNITGSTQMNCNGVTIFERPPSVSFVSSPLDAFVVMNNGQFAFAILASCGNPVKATPVVVPTPTPQPTPTPTPTPMTPATPTTVNNVNNNANTQQQQQQQSQSQSVIVNQAAAPQQTQQQTPALTPTQTQTQTQLPNTGPGAIFGIFGGTSAIGGFGHWLWRKKHLA